MSKKDRQSQMQQVVEEIAPQHEPEAPAELDVAGPLTLDEAKAVGDVPENYEPQPERSESFLKRATHLIMGGGSAEEPHVENEAEKVAEDIESAPVEEAVVDDAEKKVTFADDAKQEDGTTTEAPAEEVKKKKKSFLGFLGKKHKEPENTPEAVPDEVEVIAPAATIEEAEKTEEAVPEAAGLPQAEEKAKKKSFLGGLFHKKEKENEPVVDLAEPPAEVEPSAIEAAESTEEVAQEASEEVQPTEVPKQERKKSFFGGLFSKKSGDDVSKEDTTEVPPVSEDTNNAVAVSENAEPVVPVDATASEPTESQGFFDKLRSEKSEEQAQEEMSSAPTAAAAIAAGGGAAAVGGAAIVAAGNDEAEPVQPAQETPAVANTAEPKRRKEQPHPSADAEILKSGAVQKKSAILGWNRLRYCRVSSDGVFQWAKTEDFNMAKGMKLDSEMKIRTMKAPTSFPYSLKVIVKEKTPISLVFTDEAERDSWQSVFEILRGQLAPPEALVEPVKDSGEKQENEVTPEVAQNAAVAGQVSAN